MNRSLALVLTIAALTGAVLPTAGAAAEPPMLLSTDGTHWSPALAAPLFVPPHRWVPGDAVTATILVRNATTEDAVLVVDLTVDGSLVDAGDVRATAGVDGVRGGSLTTAGTSRLLEVAPVPGNHVVPVDLTFELDPRSGNLSQDRAARIMLELHLSADAASPGPGSTGEPDQPDPAALSATGHAWVVPAALLAAVATGTGLALASARRSISPRGKDSHDA